MITDHILQADLLDIVFDNRNKHYGAYTLRKQYNDRLYKALGITMFFILVLSAFSFLHKNKAADMRPLFDTILASIPPTIPEKQTKPKRPAKAKPPAVVAKLNTQKFTAIEIVNDPTKADRLAKNLDSMLIGNIAKAGVGGPFKPYVRPVEVNPGGSTVVITNAVDKNIPVVHPDVMPSFPGGMDALTKFLERNLNNPGEPGDEESILVKIKFIVGYDGSLKGFETVEDGGAVFNNEVIRVLKKMPQWIPGKTNGENVSVYYTIPVKFVSGNN